MSMDTKIKLYEIFLTVNGEGGAFPQGSWTVFIRFTHCPLRCMYCDTPHTWDHSRAMEMSIEEIMNKVRELGKGTKHVMITGGEPLMQDKELKELCQALYNEQYHIGIETSGSQEIPEMPVPVHWIIDYKLPESGMEDNMLPLEWFAEQLANMNSLKLVISDMKEDYPRAVQVVEDLESMVMLGPDQVMFSPVLEYLDCKELFDAMKRDGLMNVRLSMQVHVLGKLSESDDSFSSRQ